MLNKSVILFLILEVLFSTCKKNSNSFSASVPGSLMIEAHVIHHYWDVSGIMVYLKKNATDFPGNDSSKYDFKGQADGYGKITFDHLYPGNYYVYASGYDAYFGGHVIGYSPVSLDKLHTMDNIEQIKIMASE